ncbi:hypothetical protein E4U47_005170 [Claviceps purpurea]|nr:hypothetical protein E4U47_005170 [Claviceps purpurea]
MAVLDILPALTGRLFEALEMSEAEVDVTLAMAREGLEDPDVHRSPDCKRSKIFSKHGLSWLATREMR